MKCFSKGRLRTYRTLRKLSWSGSDKAGRRLMAVGTEPTVLLMDIPSCTGHLTGILRLGKSSIRSRRRPQVNSRGPRHHRNPVRLINVGCPGFPRRRPGQTNRQQRVAKHLNPCPAMLRRAMRHLSGNPKAVLVILSGSKERQPVGRGGRESSFGFDTGTQQVWEDRPEKSIWRCPACRRRSANRNQSHFCGTHDLEAHFQGKPAGIRQIYGQTRTQLRNPG